MRGVDLEGVPELGLVQEVVFEVRLAAGVVLRVILGGEGCLESSVGGVIGSGPKVIVIRGGVFGVGSKIILQGRLLGGLTWRAVGK